MSSKIDNLQNLLERGPDSALLRYSLAQEFLKAGDWEQAAVHARAALVQQPDYSAAYKALAKALVESNEILQATEVYRRGIEIADQRGDKQASKEMQVFLRRLEKHQ